MASVNIGIVGLGKMGLHHVRCVGEARGLELSVVYDIDQKKSRLAPANVPFTNELTELLRACDAVVLAVPSDKHEELGREILEAGKHLLVEKPLGVTVASCRALEKCAQSAGRFLGVGHVERMNAAYLDVEECIRRPRFVEGHRLASFDPRGTEVDVVLDLMIHDLDIVLDIFGNSPSRVEACGVSVLSDRVDIANARLEFEGGALVNLTASRVSRESVRKIRVFQEDAYMSLDFRSQRAEIFSRQPDSVPPIISREEKRAPAGHNPLVKELEQFGAAIRGESSRLASASEGTRAVALANRVLDSIERRRELWSTPASPKWADAAS